MIMRAVAVAAFLAASSTLAMAAVEGPKGGGTGGGVTPNIGGGEGPKNVPGPIAGAGLPLLLAAAGYAAWRRRKAS
ncbi:LPXTG cell wall anchor domain-containing protein [Prosthecomicrobium sp. N25]|uniref:LPXTG cell wall anchor domain-containing protein n=1 Tax=Prosthecomicrobium sp. N25 TaxID=3129254 RepID=UPI0030784759